MTRFQTVDAHVEGLPLRLVVAGVPAPRGRTMRDRCRWAAQHADRARRALLMPPRGHADLTGAFLTEPVTPGAHAGIVFMDGSGFATLALGGVIAVTTIALERGLLVPGGDGATVIFDTVAGTVRATARVEPAGSRVEAVRVLNVPSFVFQAGREVRFRGRALRVDVAFGGAFYALVDAEAAGVGLGLSHVPELRRAAPELRHAIEEAGAVTHPLDPSLSGIAGITFTGPPSGDRAALRSVTVTGEGQVDPSPCAGATAALLAVLDGMGLAADGSDLVHEGPIGTTHAARIAGRGQVAGHEAIVAEVSGTAWITAEQTVLVDDGDPLGAGFRI